LDGDTDRRGRQPREAAAAQLVLDDLKWARDQKRKQKARRAVLYALRTGKLSRPNTCARCTMWAPTHAHHPRGYDEPLDVEWLCATCHTAAHHPNSMSARISAERIQARTEGLTP